jgi:anti-sigma regulatory factor (Ser/Thr protein kinase)/anti-anti-sigma regulatory factor
VSTVVEIPATFTLQALYRFTRSIVGANGPLDDRFVLDFSKLNFIDGTGYTVLSNTIGWLVHNKVECAFRDFKKIERPGIIYLDDCGFFKNFTGEPLRREAAVRRSTLPCTSVEHARAHGWIEHRLSPWLQNILDVSYGELISLRTCVKELFNNIIDHSTQSTGYVHAQHYPNNKQVRLTISDFGRGIPATIRERFGEMSDAAAIKLASKEGVTAKSKPNNQGAGLALLIDRVTGCDGKIRIHSLSGNLYCFRDKEECQKVSNVGNGSYPGTLVEIAIDTRLFVGDEDARVDVEWF